jgi:putative toxin-antitoxin system antitoxin component (TIGR02293 family)
MDNALAEVLDRQISLEELAYLVRTGVPRRFVDELAAALKMPTYALAPVLRTSDRTLRRYPPDKHLPPEISERALTIARVLERATDVLGCRESAAGWLTDMNGALEAIPLELLDSAFGAERVLEILGRIEDTVYS